VEVKRPAAALVLSMSFAAAAPVSFASAQDKDPGKDAYARACESCHGPAGRGGQGPALLPYTLKLSELIAIVRLGIGLMPV
jgi:mono/diheme cytochrome c family protein